MGGVYPGVSVQGVSAREGGVSLVGCLSRGVSAWWGVCPPPPMNRQMAVKILSCPKLCLRAVIRNLGHRRFHGYLASALKCLFKKVFTIRFPSNLIFLQTIFTRICQRTDSLKSCNFQFSIPTDALKTYPLVCSKIMHYF